MRKCSALRALWHIAGILEMLATCGGFHGVTITRGTYPRQRDFPKLFIYVFICLLCDLKFYFSITVSTQCYFVLVAGVQHCG